MGKGTNTVVQQQTPPAQVLQNYSNLVGTASNVAATPYQQYGGNLLAPFTGMQQEGIAGLGNAGNVLQPYLGAATDYAAAGTNPISGQIPGLTGAYGNPYSQYAAAASPGFQPFNANTIGQYMSPYNQDVINSTQAQFNQQNQVQSQNLLGSAIQSGNAFGGDRAGVAQAQLAENQQLAQAPVIAGLENQNYTQALGQYNTAQGQALAGASLGAQGFGQAQQAALAASQATAGQQQAAGYQFGQLGSEALSGALTGAQAQIQGGTLEQQQQQAALNIPYMQFLQQQAYPFQTTSWLGNIVEGTGSLSGGTGTTTGPAPSLLAQGAGLGLAGLGIAGSPLGSSIGTGAAALGSGVYGAGVDATAAALAIPAIIKRGGRVDGYDQGGGVAPSGLIPYQPIQLPYMGNTPSIQGPMPSGLVGGSNIRGSGPPHAPPPPTDAQSNAITQFANMMKPLEQSKGIFGSARGGVIGYDDGGSTGNGSNLVGWDALNIPMQQAAAADASLRAQGLARGGLVGHFADGGFDPNPYDDSLFPAGSDRSWSAKGDQGVVIDARLPEDSLGLGKTPDWTTYQQGAPAAITRGLHTGAGDSAGFGAGEVDASAKPLSYADELDPHPIIKNEGGEKVVHHRSDGMKIYTGLPADDTGVQTIASSPWMGLVAAGLGMMASKSPFPGVAIGEGGLQGLGYLQQQQQRDIERRKAEAEINLKAQNLNIEQQRADQSGQQVNQQGSNIASEIATRKAGLYERQFIPGVGWVVIDKSKPMATPSVVGAPSILPGGATSQVPQPVRPGQIGPTPGAPPSPPAPTAAPAATAPARPADPMGWKPTIDMPENFYPPNHQNFLMDPKYREDMTKSGTKVIDEANTQYEAAYNTKYLLAEMDHQAANLPKAGMLSPGSFMPERLTIARNVNTISHMLGGKNVFDESNIASIEQMSKDKFRLGAELSKQIGGREPGFIVQSAVTANPGAENTATGYKRIVAGLREAAQYKEDRATFMQHWNARYSGNMTGAQDAFNQLNPSDKYAQRAIASTVDPKDAAMLRQHADNPAAINKFNQLYGAGTAQMMLGAQ